MAGSAALLALALVAQPQEGPGPAGAVPLYDDLGDHRYAVTTASPEAQAYFDQGLRLYYAFNHAESIRSFREAQRLDPSCAMCWWGEALAWGPNINLPMDSASGAAAWRAVREARARKGDASPKERALIEALAERYGPDPSAERAARDSAWARAMWRYARGRALAARGDLAGAEAELARLRAAAEDSDLVGLRLEFNTSDAVLSIAADVLAGHVATASGDHDAAVDHLRSAARREDELVYGEPPDWTVPVRQELGRVLLAAGRAADAERAFREDLARFPENGWSLHGLAEALRAQGRDGEADAVAERFREIWRTADVRPAT